MELNGLIWAKIEHSKFGIFHHNWDVHWVDLYIVVKDRLTHGFSHNFGQRFGGQSDLHARKHDRLIDTGHIIGRRIFRRCDALESSVCSINIILDSRRSFTLRIGFWSKRLVHHFNRLKTRFEIVKVG